MTLNYSIPLEASAVLAIYRGVNGSSPVDVSSTGSNGAGTSVSASSLTTTNAGDNLVLVAGAGNQGSSGNWTAPSGFQSEVSGQKYVSSETYSGESSMLADSPGPVPAGATGSVSATVAPTGELTAILLGLSPGTATTTTTYNADDEATLVTDPDGNATLTCYDNVGNVAQTVPPLGVAANSLTPSSCPTNYPTDYGASYRLASDATATTYNAEGQKTVVTTPDPAGISSPAYQTTTYSYYSNGNLETVTAPPASTSGGAPNLVTTYTYDGDNQATSVTTGSGTEQSITVYCFDADGNKLASVAPDGNSGTVQSCTNSSPSYTGSSYETDYAYTSLGNLYSETPPSTAARTSGHTTAEYTYDAVGNVLTSTDLNGVTTTNSYTPLDQLASVSYSGSSAPSVSYTFDANGSRTAMSDGSGSASYTYDAFGEPTAIENGASKTVDYSYDALGNRTSITYPLGSAATWASTDSVSYVYDAASRGCPVRRGI